MREKDVWKLVEIEADKTNCNKRKVGCIIYNALTEKIVGRGHNFHKDMMCDCSTAKTAIHAEIQAIEDIDVTDINFDKDQCVAVINHRPCDNCSKELSKVVYEVRYRYQ